MVFKLVSGQIATNMVARPNHAWGTVQGLGYISFAVTSMDEVLSACDVRADCTVLPQTNLPDLAMLQDPEGNIVELLGQSFLRTRGLA